MLPGRNDTGHDEKAKGVLKVIFLRNARGNDGSVDELTVESSSTTSL